MLNSNGVKCTGVIHSTAYQECRSYRPNSVRRKYKKTDCKENYLVNKSLFVVPVNVMHGVDIISVFIEIKSKAVIISSFIIILFQYYFTLFEHVSFFSVTVIIYRTYCY